MKINIDIVSGILVTARALEKAGDVIFSRFGLTMGSYEMLRLIAEHTDTTTKLAAASQITLAGVTHKTKLLEAKGYIKRLVNQEDKRGWYFSVTPKGRGRMEAIQAVYEEMTVHLFNKFEQAHKLQTLRLLTETEKHLRHVSQNRQFIVERTDELIKQKGLKLD